MIRTAVLLTVFNRKDVTLRGLGTLYRAIDNLRETVPGDEYQFDIFMTDDGCTDGTCERVMEVFPEVRVVPGDGNLFWSRGMRKAWQAALKSGIPYDFFMWFNDDVELSDDAISTLFRDAMAKCDRSIIVGAFCNRDGCVSYGGRVNNHLVPPNGDVQPIELMNGNLVLIPRSVYAEVGLIDKHYHHGEGDFDYGFRARSSGLGVFLTHKYVGVAIRHDETIPRYCSSKYSFKERWRILHAPYSSLWDHFRFNSIYRGFFFALSVLMVSYLGVLSPRLYKLAKARI